MCAARTPPAVVGVLIRPPAHPRAIPCCGAPESGQSAHVHVRWSPAWRAQNCTGLEDDTQRWIERICDSAVRDAGWAPTALPLACRAPRTMPVADAGWPRVHGHAYASTDPKASADFAVKYFGATLLRDDAPRCAGPADARAPREVTVRLPHHADYRGGGLVLRFVSNPRKPGGAYDIARHAAAMRVLYGNLSVNTGHHWNQFFDRSARAARGHQATPARPLRPRARAADRCVPVPQPPRLLCAPLG